MCNYYKDTRLAGNIINLTDRMFWMYEEVTGSVEPFYVSKQRLPMEPQKILNSDELAVHYVVDKKEYRRLKKLGRKLDDIAVISEHFDGNHPNMVYLAWAKDPTIKVVFYGSGHLISFKHK